VKRIGRLARACALALACSASAHAHAGPPFPVAVDRMAGPYKILVWADPDVGIGTFFVSFDPPIPSGERAPLVRVSVHPLTGRLEPATFAARVGRDGTFKAEIPFDREERWAVRVDVDGAAGQGGIDFEVDVTPPGYGAWDLAIYGAPFLLVGILWAAVALRRRALVRATANES
jgi:hypothetical protein